MASQGVVAATAAAELTEEQRQAQTAAAAARDAEIANQARFAAQAEGFCGALVEAFFGGADPDDTALTLQAFPEVIQTLKTQLGPLAETPWWADATIKANLRTFYPALTAVLERPGFPAWMGKLWAVLMEPAAVAPATEEAGEGQEGVI